MTKEFDKDFGKEFPIANVDAEIVPSKEVPEDMLEYRDQLLREYNDGNSGLIDRLTKEGKTNVESLVMALANEIIAETDNLKANELIAMKNGNLRDATIISDKRAGVLAMAIKSLQAKQTFDRDNGIDLDSPSIEIIFQFFMRKTKGVFEELKFDSEQIDIFFQTLGVFLENWKKELQSEIDDMTMGK